MTIGEIAEFEYARSKLWSIRNYWLRYYNGPLRRGYDPDHYICNGSHDALVQVEWSLREHYAKMWGLDHRVSLEQCIADFRWKRSRNQSEAA